MPRIGFSDGSSRDVDLTGELHTFVFEPLADPEFFAQVHIDDELGTVVWPGGADLDPLVLHGDFERDDPACEAARLSRCSAFVAPRNSGRDAGRAEDLDAVVGGSLQYRRHVGRLGRCGRDLRDGSGGT